MRRISLRSGVAAAVAAVLALGLGACNSDSLGGGSGGSSTGGVQNLVVYSADPANAKIYQGLLDEFGAANNAKVQLVSYPSADFIQNFTSAVNGNSQIDALFANGQDVRYLKSKSLLRDVSGVADTSALQPIAVDPFTIDSKQYAVGIGAINVTAWVYNADIFAKYKLSPPTSVDDVAAIADKLKGTGIAPVSVPGGNVYLWPIWMMQGLQQTTQNKPLDTTFSTLKTGAPDFTSPEYVDALGALSTLGSDKVFANGYQALQQDAANALFSDGKAAMFFGGTWDVSTIVQQSPKLNVKLVPFPTFRPGVQSASFGGVGMAAAAYSKAPSEHTDLVNKMIQYMASADADKTIMDGSTSAIGLPAVKSVQPAGTSPLQKELIESSLPSTVTFLDWYWPKDVTAAYQQNIQAVVGGTKSPQEASTAVQKAFDDAKADGWTFS